MNTKNEIKKDLVIVVAESALVNINLTIEWVRKNVHDIGQVYVITSAEGFSSQTNGAIFIDELKIGVDKNEIKKWFSAEGFSERRINWYFQQFLKLAACRMVETDYFIIWDGDTIPLQEIKPVLHSGDDVELVVRPTTEHHFPYFKTNMSLLNLNKLVDHSFISEYCVVKKRICEELINEIDSSGSNAWYINILNSIERRHVEASGFSEYELIGNYQTLHGVKYSKYSGRSFRKASSYFGIEASSRVLLCLSQRYTMVSFETWGVAGPSKKYLFNRLPVLSIVFEYFLEPLRVFKRWATRIF